MKSFIVPTDFSETSVNAARYAIQLAAGVENVEVVLYNIFDKMSVGSDGTPLHTESGSLHGLSMLALENLKAQLQPLAPQTIVNCIAEETEGSVVKTLQGFKKRHGGDLLIMGITGSSRLEQVFMGSNVLDVINEDICPVMIIPPAAVYTGAKKALFITDMRDVEKTTPLAPMKRLLNIFKPSLQVINVDAEHYIELTEENKAERNKLAEMFSEYNPSFSFLRFFDFVDGVNLFADEHKIDVIFTVPRKHNFLVNLFKTSHTSKLAYHSHVPIIAVHE
jgi:nucleotide-binding universal stress UspA family protein